jgi:hypothetical protein
MRARFFLVGLSGRFSNFSRIRSRFRGYSRIRTYDFHRVNELLTCKLLNLGESVAPKSTRKHPKSTFSTLVSTLKTKKVEVLT